ncbi:MAG: DUF1553 domain-containing protein [Planctomycetes bacterium]|nr:DUF1553 domain-containing protein [Planctomycetota bacterium]
MPAEVTLEGRLERAQLLVRAAAADAAGSADLTRQAAYASSNEAVVSVDQTGRLVARGDGQAEVSVTVGEATKIVTVTVAGAARPPQVDFTRDVLPILSKHGCNMGACHASQYGQGGFKLSVFGFDPAADREGIVRDSIGRRVNFNQPENSLFLRKPTMQIGHGGGLRLETGSVDYELLKAWIAAGAPGPQKEPPKLARLSVEPDLRRATTDDTQQLRAVAHYSDGRVRDVTAWALFDSMDDGVLAVDENGLVKVVGQGQAPVMVRFEGQAEIATFVVPFSQSVELAGWENRNFIDEHAAVKFRQLGIEPSPVCDDATFLRRAFLDATGALPTVEETRAFLSDPAADKRDRLIARLLGLTGDAALDIYNDRYAAYWTLKWSDLIRNESNALGEQGMWALHNWIRESFRTNKPFDRFVRELVVAQGSIYSNGPANYYRINRSADELAESTSQLFLGVRLTCAKCHHHPFEKYSQGDYYGFAAFFSRVGTKNSEEFGLFGRESVVVVKSSGSVRHPRTGQTMPPTPLEGEPVEHPLDLRIPLAEWLTSPENRAFPRSVVNRYVAYLLGHGLVDPVDDMRATNPPSNVELMEALTQHFMSGGYNIKELMRTIMTSRLYQLSSQPTEANAADRRFYSHFKVKRIPAEPLLDAIDHITGSPTKFRNLPAGTRAIELPDAEYPDYFLNVFGKPRRASVCECERMPDENLSQALHTLNGDILAAKIAAKGGRVATLLAAKKPHEEIVEELYVAALSRPPSDAEREACRQFLAEASSPQECYEDLLWALVNSKQFLFVR